MPSILIPPSASGKRLTEFLSLRGIAVSAPCGGRGVCKKCRVQVVSGRFLSRITGKELLPDADGCILACQAICPSEGAEIVVPDTAGDGLTVNMVKTEENTGQVFLAEAAGASAPDSNRRLPHDGIALDIGTTTLAAARVDRVTGKTVATVSCLNPQQSFGADVISRIGACSQGSLAAMQACLLTSVREMIGRLFPGVDFSGVLLDALPDLSVAGNATMLHIFCGVSPEGMGTYPFTPDFTETRILSGAELDLPVRQVTVLPSVSAFVGGDITAGMLVCGLGQSPVPCLLLDIGTNGEMVLDTGKNGGNRLIAASTAAGPALEGANISCGMGGVAGAVSRVTSGVLPDTLVYRTIGDAPAGGICGCGLIDLCACLLELEVMDETGCLDDDPYILSGAHSTPAGLAPAGKTPVKLTQKDIREVQLAKSALRAGMEALLDAAGLDACRFTAAGGKVFIAGGLGYYLDTLSAVRIGLLPPAFLITPGTVTAVGNTALSGAIRVLTDASALAKLSRLAGRCECIELNRSKVFNDGFIENMIFPEEL
ncbi:MAG: ASKHA domain-containing protein [Firmicutes bacterium]|nr:ASKHA domain-containing protein [Bacillota bacterium]